MRPFVAHTCGVIAAALVLGFVAEAHAAVPRGLLAQRRGRMPQMPAKPAVVDSSGSIDNLNKALKALGATDLDYDGHREKAILHVAAAIHHLETASGRGKSNAAISKAEAGTHAVATKTATTPQDASDASLRKAKAILFVVHHELADHPASKGQIHADASIRVAITEIVTALTPPKATAPAASVTAPAPSATSSTLARPAR